LSDALIIFYNTLEIALFKVFEPCLTCIKSLILGNNMPEYKRLKAIFFWFLLVSSDTAAQILVKKGAVSISSSGWINCLIPLGYSFYIISFIAWMQILKNTRLSIALSAASVLYITVAISSHIFLGEAITIQITIGTILISIGVFILAWSESKRSKHL
jgi:drug/metabolite transporter (DMT)-like permease